MMIDGRALGDDVAADVCVVGAGPAGIAVALELEAAGLEVALVVGGGADEDARYQRLNVTRQIGQPFNAVEGSTVRALGGASSRWVSLWLRPLDALDLEERPEVPNSGWPFGLETLQPHYPRAFELCGVKPAAPDPGEPVLGSPALRRANFSLAGREGPRRFGIHFRPQLLASSRIRALLDTSAVEIEPDAAGQRVAAVRAATLDGRRIRVRARCFVLACGTIQNTRLLLCSRALSPRGLGNDSDLVGRFFMQHACHESVLLTFTREARRSLSPENGVATALAPSFVREEKLLNCHFLLLGQRELADPPSRGLLGRLRDTWAQRQHLAAQGGTDVAVGRALGPYAHRSLSSTDPVLVYCRLIVRPEQVPNAESRVVVDDADRDALGMPRAVVDWRLTPLDWQNADRAAQIVGAAMGAAGLGRVRAPRGTEGVAPAQQIHGGHHHYGTTRMHADPRRGVVDADCRVHGLGNLFVAGSAVFPTTGYANPTLTLVALAVRLGRHIVDRRLARDTPLAS